MFAGLLRVILEKKRRFAALLILLFIVLDLIGNAVSIWSYSYRDEKQKADAAIVLGAATYDGTVSPVFQERINHAIWLYVEGFVDKIIMTGGFADGNMESDAFTAKKYALSKGVLEADILIEEASTITQENLVNAKLVMDDNDLLTAILVSDPLHMRRSMLLAKDAGIKACSSPTPTSKYISLKTKVPFCIREVFFYVGYKVYRIFN